MRSFEVVAFKDISPCTESNWLIQDLLMVNSIAILYGDSNIGKSFLTLSMAFSIATGRDFLGRNVKQGASFWLAAEGGGRVNNRFEAIKRHYEVNEAPLYLINSDADFYSSESDAKALISAIKARATADNQTPALVVIDTLTKVSRGANQNSQQDMGIVLKSAELIQRELGCAILMVHHGSKDPTRGSRGTNALQCDVDTEILVTKGEIAVTKQRDGEKDRRMGFGLHLVEVGVDDKTGQPVTSCVAVPSVLKAKPTKDQRPRERTLQALEVLRELTGQLGPKVPVAAWSKRFKAKHLADPDMKPSAKSQAFRIAAEQNYVMGFAETEDELAWLTAKAGYEHD